MEEDIKRIEEIKKEYSTMDGLKEYVKAIENILNRLEQYERVIGAMAKHIDTYTYRDSRDDYGCDFQMQTKCTCNYKDCNKCIIDHFRKKCE